MTAPRREKSTHSFEGSPDGPASSDFVASCANQHHAAKDPLQSHPLESADTPAELQRALRAARTPLVAGVDFKAADSRRDAPLPDCTQAEFLPLERSRVDTLSPLESVPPPAPYPTEPPAARPSVVPPVCLAFNDPQSPRTRSDPPTAGIRSDSPPRVSRSDPPPESSGRAPTSHRRSWGAGPSDPMPASLEAQRREAVTIPADAYSPSPAQAYDALMPFPALRAPSFPFGHLPATIRQHENSRLRTVTMTLMFVVCVVTGAIAGMRWYVAREDEVAPTRNDTASEAPHAHRLKLDRLEPNAVVAPRASADVTMDRLAESAHRTPRNSLPAQSTAKNAIVPAAAASDGLRDSTSVPSPWDTHPASRGVANDTQLEPRPRKTERTNGEIKQGRATVTQSRTSRRPDSSVVDPKAIDTKTPLIMD